MDGGGEHAAPMDVEQAAPAADGDGALAPPDAVPFDAAATPPASATAEGGSGLDGAPVLPVAHSGKGGLVWTMSEVRLVVFEVCLMCLNSVYAVFRPFWCLNTV